MVLGYEDDEYTTAWPFVTLLVTVFGRGIFILLEIRLRGIAGGLGILELA